MRMASKLLLLMSVVLPMACGSPRPLGNDVVREGAETRALIDEAKSRLSSAESENEGFGKPLPPLRGVQTPMGAQSNAVLKHEVHKVPPNNSD